MISRIRHFAGILLWTLAGTACFEVETFTDLPEDLEERRERYEIAVTLLQALKTADLETTLTALTHDDPRVRRAAASRLQVIGTDADAAAPELIRLLKTDPDLRVRTAAARSLEKVRSPDGYHALVQMQCDPEYDVRLFAWKSLLRVRDAAYPAILNGLTAPPDAEEECPLDEYDTHRTLRQELRDRILLLESRMIPLMTRGLHHDDTQVLGMAIDLLGRQGAAAATALPAIADLSTHTDDDIRAAALRTLGRIGDLHPVVMPTLHAAKTDPSTKVAAAANSSIASIEKSLQRRNAPNPGIAGSPRPSAPSVHPKPEPIRKHNP